MNSSDSHVSPQTWFTEARFGLFIHFGLYSSAARDVWLKSDACETTESYQRLFDGFDPDMLNAESWAQKAWEAGMRYMVITAKHHDGFCLWDTAFTDYKSTASPSGRDIIAEVVQAFRKRGLRIGLYYSLLDWHHPDYTVDRRHPQRGSQEERRKDERRDIRRYAAYMRDQITELLSNYGRIDILWVDFSFPGEDGKDRSHWESEQFLALARQLQPEILINNRLDLPGLGDFTTPEQYQPLQQPVDDSGAPLRWEGCHTLGRAWGYSRSDCKAKSCRELLTLLIDSVGKNGNMLLNVGPDGRGKFPPTACERLSGIAEWMKLHEHSIRGCGSAPGEIPTPPAGVRYTFNTRTSRLYVHLFEWPLNMLFLPGLSGRVSFARFLHDGGEAPLLANEPDEHVNLHEATPPGCLALGIPDTRPEVEIPVIELYLTQSTASSS